MSQDVAISAQTANLLQGIRAKLSSAYLQEPVTESLSEGIGSSYGIIHYRGKNWSLSHRGATHLFTRPDDGTAASYIDVVILRQARNKSKSFYEGFDQDAANKRPICAALDGERPDADVQAPQAQACAICPRNTWKTDQNGKRTKDCSDYKRVAVLLMPSQSARMFNGVPLMEPVFLRVPAASLADLAAYGDQLMHIGIPYHSLVTRVSFDPTKAHPQMQFRPLQGLTDAEAPVVLPLRDDMITKRIIGADVIRPALLAAPVVAQAPVVQAHPQTIIQPQFVSPAPPPVAQPIIIQQPPPVAQPTIIQQPPPVAQPIIIQQPPQMTIQAPPPETVSFMPPATPAPAPQPQMLAPSDVGAPQEADAILDGRLSALFPATAAA